MKDMELYDSFIRETNDLLGAPTQKWAYKERDAWKDNGESELVLLRDAAYELGGGANEAVNSPASRPTPRLSRATRCCSTVRT